jgi:exonuclease III
VNTVTAGTGSSLHPCAFGLFHPDLTLLPMPVGSMAVCDCNSRTTQYTPREKHSEYSINRPLQGRGIKRKKEGGTSFEKNTKASIVKLKKGMVKNPSRSHKNCEQDSTGIRRCRRLEAVVDCDDRLVVWGTTNLMVSEGWNLVGRLVVRLGNMVTKICRRVGDDNKVKLEFFLKNSLKVSKLEWSKDVITLSRLLKRFGRYTACVKYQRKQVAAKLPLVPREGGLRFWSWNVNGLRFKSHLIQNHLDNFSPDILCVQETRSKVADLPVGLNGYQTYEQHADSKIGGARGLTTFVSSDFKSYVTLRSPHWLITKVFGGSLASVSFVVNVYLPGKQTGIRTKVMMEFAEVLKVAHKQAKGAPVIIMGDFNGTGKQIDSWVNRKGLSMFERNEVSGDSTTYFSGKRESDIDHVLTNFDLEKRGPTMVLRDVVGSDHCPISITVGNLLKDCKVSTGSDACLFKRINVGLLERGKPTIVACHNFWDALEEGEASVDELDAKFTSVCHNVAEEVGLHVEPRKLINKRRKRVVDLRACTKRSIVKMKILEDKVRVKQESGSGSSVTGERELSELSRAKVRTRSLLARDHRISNLKSVVKCCRIARYSNAKAYWRWARNYGSNPSYAVGVDPVQDPLSKKLLVGTEEVKLAWTAHYKSLSTFGVDEALVAGSGDEERVDAGVPILGTPDLCELVGINEEITWGEICDVGNAMRRGKAPGDFDLIPLEFLATCLDQKDPATGRYPAGPATGMGKRLTELMLRVWNEEMIPAAWNCSTVVSIPKKGDLTNMDNYRGISLQAIVMKLFSALINKRVYGALEKGNRFSNAQAGFRSSEECQAQAVALYEALIRRKNVHLSSYACFLDMRKAFDMVPHAAMLEKCSKIGIRGKCLNILKAMYENSTFRVRGGFGYTELISLLRGVKQGSPLSPTLFDIFINDLLDGAKELGLSVPTGESFDTYTLPGLLFADDLVLLADSMKNLQKLLNLATNWANKWGMRFGLDKCAIICFGGDRAEVDKEEWVLQEQRVEVRENYTYLGILFTEDLDLIKMSESRLLAGRKALGALRPLLFSRLVPMHTKVMIIKACVLPVLMFGAELWGMNGKLVGKHQSLLNASLRWVAGAQGGSACMSTTCAWMEFNIPPLQALSAAARARALKKYENCKSAVSDLIVSAPNTRKATWVTGGLRWLNKFVTGSPGENVSECMDRGPLSPKYDVSRHNVGCFGNDAWGTLTKTSVLERVLSNDVSAQAMWYKKHFIFKGSSNWYWLSRCAPEWAEGFCLLTNARLGGFISAVKWANMRLLSPKWKSCCPHCSLEVPESIYHVLMVCDRWAVERKRYLGTLLDLIYREFPLESCLDGEEAYAALVLGGKSGEFTVPFWAPRPIKFAKRSLLESYTTESMDCLKELVPGKRMDADEDAYDFKNCFALKVAKYLLSINKVRMQRLGSLRDVHLKAIYGQRRKISRPRRVLPETVDVLS